MGEYKRKVQQKWQQKLIASSVEQGTHGLIGLAGLAQPVVNARHVLPGAFEDGTQTQRRETI